MQIKQTPLIAITVLILMTWGAMAAPSANTATFQVAAGPHLRVNTPVTLKLPPSMMNHQHFILTNNDTQTNIPIQRLGPNNPRAVFIIREPHQPNQTRNYALTPSPAPSGAPATICIDDGQHLILKAGATPILQYNHATIDSPPGIEAHYRRSGYIHPLYSPAGTSATGDFPPDHAHQHGIFFPWVNATFQNRPVDFWNQTKNAGMIQHLKTTQTRSGPVFAQFTVQLQHADLTAPHSPQPAINETWTVRAYNITQHFIVDIISHQTTATQSPLTINEYRYGGMALRGNQQWYSDEIEKQIQQLPKIKGAPQQLEKVPTRYQFLTSENKTRLTGNATRANWVETFGQVNQQPTAVAVLSHPDNFRSPQPVRLHPSKPYFCFAPMILGDFTLQPDQTYISRYRYYIHNSKTNHHATEQIWHNYATPPKSKLISTAP